MTHRLSFDTGGTFTDLALVDVASGQARSWKTPTTPDDPSVGVATGIAQLLEAAEVAPAAVGEAVRGATTLVTNALLERRGGRVGLIVTAGFADVIEIGREWRYDIHDLTIRMPAPLVAPEHRFEVRERMRADGSVFEPLRLDDLESAAAAFEAAGLDALAVCFLHSHRNDAHERAAVSWLRERLPGVPVIASAGGASEIREYERWCTATASAYVAPVAERHLRDLQAVVAGVGVGADVALMHSAGGLMSTAAARAEPIRLLESGPAAGALGAAFVAAAAGERRVAAFDMGGTTAKICVIDDGAPELTSTFEAARVHRFKRGSGIPIMSPAVDLLEIGAGGGSIARVDELGLLKVGPVSAGAVPGPACYQRGGADATVTDADLCLGYLAPEAFLGGRMTLSLPAAEAAIANAVAEPLGIGLVEAAAGIARVVNENMANAARVHLLEKGRDPRAYALVASGGAGPVHARDVAARIGIRRVVCPLFAGVLSAIGLHVARSTIDRARAVEAVADDVDWSAVDEEFATLERGTADALRAMGVERIEHVRSIEMRYAGQGYEIVVPAPPSLAEPDAAAAVVGVFRDRYRALFAADASDGAAVEVVRLRLQSRDGDAGRLALRPGDVRPGGDASSARVGERPVFDMTRGEMVSAQVYEHELLAAGSTLSGPAIVQQRASAAVLFSGDEAEVDGSGSLIVDLPG